MKARSQNGGRMTYASQVVGLYGDKKKESGEREMEPYDA